MELNINNILKDIYNDIYLYIADHSKNIFLCGAKLEKSDSLRSIIYEYFKKFAMFNFAFPEQLFARLTRAKEFNILELENKLAEYVDIIILPLEGSGTLAELGAFSSNKDLLKNIIVICDSEYKRKKSFINFGPINLILSNNKNHILYFKKEKKEKIPKGKNRKKLLVELMKVLIYSRYSRSKRDINNLFNLSRFILYLIGIFQPISLDNINKMLKEYFGNNLSSYLVEPSIENLFVKEYVEISMNYRDCYSLSNIGNQYMYNNLLDNFTLRKKFSRIRALVINSKLRKKGKLDLEAQRQKFLELRAL